MLSVIVIRDHRPVASLRDRSYAARGRNVRAPAPTSRTGTGSGSFLAWRSVANLVDAIDPARRMSGTRAMWTCQAADAVCVHSVCSTGWTGGEGSVRSE